MHLITDRVCSDQIVCIDLFQKVFIVPQDSFPKTIAENSIFVYYDGEWYFDKKRQIERNNMTHSLVQQVFHT